MHTMIIGTSTRGKSYLAKQIINHAEKQGINSLVLDPHKGTGWGNAWVTDDWQQFLAVAKANTRCLLMIEECRRTMGLLGSEQNLRMAWCATESSHNGHHAYFLGQRYTMIPPDVRENIDKGYVFHQRTTKACKQLAEDFAGHEYLINCYKLDFYQFYAVNIPGMRPGQVYTLKQ